MQSQGIKLILMKAEHTHRVPHATCSMRKLCPNFDREDGLETVLEVPIPEETFAGDGRSGGRIRCRNMMGWMRSHISQRSPASGSCSELQLMLGVVGAPLVPLHVPPLQHSPLGRGMKEDPIEASMAKYIVQQYLAAAGGEKRLNEISSMYVMGKVKMSSADDGVSRKKSGEMGGFVLWQKTPELWCLELVVSGCKISAGSNGKIAWRQTPWQQPHASRGPPRPLRRCLQGLDPKSTANIFTAGICIGEKTINNDECFVLRLDAEPSALRSRSSSTVEIIRHTLWGYFSQRTALLLHLEDSHLLRIKNPNQESVYWETTTESSISDYRLVDGIQIAHAGRTNVSLFRFGETGEGNCARTRMEETWTVEEVDFNILGLSMDCFLPPADIKVEREGVDEESLGKISGIRMPTAAGNFRIGASRIAAVNIEETTGQ